MTSNTFVNISNQSGAHRTQLLNFAFGSHETLAGIGESQRLCGAIHKLSADFRFQTMHKL